MSFIGLVTRKEEDTGVTLRAKIVTPNKKRFQTKDFKVKVKANALDDYSCCVIDHATAKNRIENSQDMLNLIDDLTLPYSGSNGTTISYNVINNTDASTYDLTDYLGEDGKILGRPKYNAEAGGAATGYLEIVVTKGDAKVASRIVIAVSGTTADEVLASDTYTDKKLWALIAGKNTGTYNRGSEASPHNNIQHPLLFSNAQTLNDPNSTTPITVTWTVVDALTPYLSSNVRLSQLKDELGGASRIADDGTVTRPSYGAACSAIDQVNGITAKIIGTAESSTSSNNRRVRIDGITITAVLELGTARKTVVFNCATVSKYITNSEIMSVVKSGMALFRADGAKISYKDKFDDAATVIYAPAAGGSTTIRAYTNIGVTNLFSNEALHLDAGTINNVEVTHTIWDANDAGISCDDSILYALNNGFVADASGDPNYQVLNINFDEFNSLGSSLRKFTIYSNVKVSSYSTTGEDLSSTTQYFECYAKIEIDTSGIVVTPPTGSAT